MGSKNGSALLPHIGSLEFFVVAGLLCELHLELICNLSKLDIEKAWIKKFKIKAGAEAETIIEKEHCECVLISKSEKTINQNWIDSTFETKIGKATITLTLRHPEPTGANTISMNSVKNINQTIQKSFFNIGYKIPVHRLSDITINTKTCSLESTVSIENQELVDEFRGMSAEYQPCYTYCDAILVAGQLSQILIFNVDSVTRDQAANLWMRSIEAEYNEPIGDQFITKLKADKFTVIRVSDDIKFRATTLLLDCDGGKMTAKFKLAYKM